MGTRVMPFRYRLIVTVISTVLLPSIVVNILTFSFIKEQMLEDAEEWLARITVNTGNTLDSYLQLVQGVTKNPLYDYTLMDIFDNNRLKDSGTAAYSRDERSQIYGSLATMAEMDENIFSAVFYDRNGNRFQLGRDGFDLKLEREIALQAKRNEGRIMFGHPVILDNQIYLPVSRSMIHPRSHQEVATLLLLVRFGFIGAAEDELVAKTGGLRMLDTNDEIIFDSRQSRIGEKMDWEDPGMFYTTYKSKLTEWTVVCSVPTSVLFSEINQLQRWVLMINVILFIIALSVIVFFSMQMTRPLRRLSEIMQTAYKTEFREVYFSAKRRDEIGMIANSFNHMIRQIQSLINKVVDTERHRKQSQITALQAQINPHFLYNSLHMIAMQAELEDHYTISEMASLLSKLLRYSVGNREEWVPVEQECEHLNAYIRLMQFRFPRIEFHLEVDEQVKQWTMMRLLLQPMVENAIIHGLIPQQEGGTIYVSIREINMTDDRRGLSIRVDDNGMGMSAEWTDMLMKYLRSEEGTKPPYNQHGGIGLKNVYDRLALYYERSFDFRITSQENYGTQCRIDLPRREDDEGHDR